jgi:hypothetical protein
MWPVKTTREFDDWFVDLDSEAQSEIIARVELLKRSAPSSVGPTRIR